MRRHCRRGRIGFVLASLLIAGSQAPMAVADGSDQNVIVSPVPIKESPRIQDGRVYTIAAAGEKIIVGGTFTAVRDWNATTTVTRNRIFAFDRVTGLIDNDFAPSFNEHVSSVVPSADGQWVYIGGAFSTINGAPRSRLVKLSVADGNIDPIFTGTANRAINDMALTGNSLIVGGTFTKLTGVDRQLIGAVDGTTGKSMDWLNLPVAVSRDETLPFIQELDVSPDGQRLAIVGNFMYVNGLPREQLALIDLTTQPPSLADWATSRYHAACASVYDNTYMRDIAFSPDSSFFVAVTTGAFFAGTLCDAAARWETYQTGSTLQPTWVDYTGGDTYFQVLITNAAVYAGGHQRWANNPTPSPRGDNDGPGSVSRRGIAALDPLTGVPLSWNPGRARGRGVEALLATPDYLYVGSDTVLFNGSSRDRLAVLPTSSGVLNPGPEALSLPVKLYAARTDGYLYRSDFDGNSVSTVTLVSGPAEDGNNWSSLRDGFVQNGTLFYYGTAGAYYKRSFDGATFGPLTNLSTSVGYLDVDYNLTPYDQPYGVDTTRAVAYQNGRLYYTRSNDTRLFWRWFSLESGIIGAQEYVASGANWSGVTGLEIAGHWLYASWNDNKLYRAYVDGPAVDASSKTVVDDGTVSGTPWSSVRALAFTQGSGTGYEPPPPPPPPPNELTCPAGQWKAEYYPSTQLVPPVDTVRCETSLFYNWGYGSPADTNVGPDQFSVRWTRRHSVAQTAYHTFTVRADDGIRLSVDGVVLINQWRDQSATTYSATVSLSPGDHEFSVEYYEKGGQAVAQFSYQVL